MPVGHTVVIKQLAAYAASTLADVNVFLRHGHAGEALWRHNVPATTSSWGGFYGAFVFESGSSFYFHVDAAPVDGADCFASGYDLLADA